MGIVQIVNQRRLTPHTNDKETFRENSHDFSLVVMFRWCKNFFKFPTHNALFKVEIRTCIQ